MAKVFLGGTWSGSTWRDKLIPLLKIDYFNPVVPDWNEHCREIERYEHATCDLRLYVITPLMHGVYSIAEAVRDSIRDTRKTVFCIMQTDDGKSFDDAQLRSLAATSELCAGFGAHALMLAGHIDIDALAEYLNRWYVEPPAYTPYTIECLIERDGTTEMYIDGFQYLFEKNTCGHYVCNVQRNDHRAYLCKLKDFRVYQQDKLPPPEFTDAEMDFMREWRTMDQSSFREYVNGRTNQFNKSSLKIRRIAQGKWIAINAKDKTPQAFPVDMSDDDPEPIQEDQAATEPVGDFDESDNWTAEQWEEWCDFWRRLAAPPYEKFVTANENKFLNAPDDIWAKAMGKWEKLLPEKPWPLAPDEDDQ